ncbi:gamma-glutamylcyclotransferase family protein [Brevibacillus migulae]|uniref:gamma-glutamylcyclotransferase family protein n=1 Tax=Brevibacillus migulae TaxID=1644114 RepID=UPI00106E1048|nr:gamma-glutamylcyclotransferase family protein [Brevibacillus migulae]
MGTKLPVFVYGSLLAGFANHRHFVEPYPHHRVRAKTRGKLYHLSDRGYPALVSADEPHAWVYGELLYFAPVFYEKALKGLDELEDYHGPADERNEYERQKATVTFLETEKQTEAFLYIAAPQLEKAITRTGIRVTDGDWRTFMQRK